MSVQKWSMEWGGRTLSVEVGKLALQANASCVVSYGDTVILATATMSKNTRDGIDFFPLMVNFEEKLYAAGKIKGSRFIKREGRPSDEAILSGRLVDRAIRPLFNQAMRNDVQVILTALSFDGEVDSQIPAMIAASMVLSISSIPWNGPIGGVRIGQVNGNWKINPTIAEQKTNTLNLVVAGTPEKVIMVEAGCKDMSDNQVIEAMQFGAAQMAPVIEFIKKIQAEVGQTKFDMAADASEQAVKLAEAEKLADELVASHVADWIFDAPKMNRRERVALIDKFSDAIKQMLVERETDETVMKIVLGRVKIYVEKYITEQIIHKDQRLDGRGKIGRAHV